VLVCGAGHWWTVVWARSVLRGTNVVTGEIVGISPTFVVGGELNQHKSGGSLSPLGLAFGV